VNRLMNQVREYWYIGSTMAKSLMQKNSREARTACAFGLVTQGWVYISILKH